MLASVESPARNIEYDGVVILSVKTHVEMMRIENVLQAPVIIFCPTVELSSDGPCCRKMENMFQILFWKFFQFLWGNVAKKYRREKSINIPAMDTHKPLPNESRNWEVQKRIISKSWPSNIAKFEVNVPVQLSLELQHLKFFFEKYTSNWYDITDKICKSLEIH